jgi:hypothetical protein
MAIVTVIVLGALLASNVQSLLSGSAGGSQVVSGQHTATVLPSPTAAPPTPTATPTNWLVADPTQITLSCTTKKIIRLTNVGPETVHWQALPGSAFVVLSLTSGRLHPDTSVSITVGLRFVNFSSHGTIIFTVTSGQQAGNPAAVTYTSSPCIG